MISRVIGVFTSASHRLCTDLTAQRAGYDPQHWLFRDLKCQIVAQFWHLPGTKARSSDQDVRAVNGGQPLAIRGKVLFFSGVSALASADMR